MKRFRIANPKISLHKRNFNFFTRENFCNFVIDFSLSCHHRVDITQNHAQLKIQSRIAKTTEQALRSCWKFGNILNRTAHLFQKFHNSAGLCSISNPNLYDQTAGFVVPCPVCHRTRHQVRIGYDHSSPVKCFNCRRTHRNGTHRSHDTANFNPISFRNWTLNEQDDPRNEI